MMVKRRRLEEPIRPSARPPTQPPTPPPKKRGRPRKIDSDIRTIADRTRQEMWNIAAYNRMPPEMMEERIQHRLPKVYEAPSVEEAIAASERAVQSAEMMCLKLRGEGKIQGPKTVRNLEVQARKNESLALWMFKQGNDKAAETASKKAASLRAEAEELKKSQDSNSNWT